MEEKIEFDLQVKMKPNSRKAFWPGSPTDPPAVSPVPLERAEVPKSLQGTKGGNVHGVIER